MNNIPDLPDQEYNTTIQQKKQRFMLKRMLVQKTSKRRFVLNNIQACGTSGQHLNVGAHRNQDQNLKKTSGNRCGHVPGALILLVKKILPERLPYQVKDAIAKLEEISKLGRHKLKRKTQRLGVFKNFLIHSHADRLLRSERREVCLALLSIMAADANIKSKKLGQDSEPVRTMQHYMNMVHKNARDHGRESYSEDRIRYAFNHLEKTGYLKREKKYKVTELNEVRVYTEIHPTNHFFIEIMGCKQKIIQKENIDALNKAPERQDRPYYQIAKIETQPSEPSINTENSARLLDLKKALKGTFQMPMVMAPGMSLPKTDTKKLSIQEEIELQMAKFRQQE